jgi:hypothetical protein
VDSIHLHEGSTAERLNDKDASMLSSQEPLPLDALDARLDDVVHSDERKFEEMVLGDGLRIAEGPALLYASLPSAENFSQARFR